MTDLKSVLNPDSSIGERSWIILAALIEEKEAWRKDAETLCALYQSAIWDLAERKPDNAIKAHRALVKKYK